MEKHSFCSSQELRLSLVLLFDGQNNENNGLGRGAERLRTVGRDVEGCAGICVVDDGVAGGRDVGAGVGDGVGVVVVDVIVGGVVGGVEGGDEGADVGGRVADFVGATGQAGVGNTHVQESGIRSIQVSNWNELVS